MKPAFRATLLLSLLVHLMVMLPWLLDGTSIEQTSKEEATMEFTLAPQAKPPEPQPPIKQPEQKAAPPPPKHLEDDITKANLKNGIAETPNEAKAKRGNLQKPKEAMQPAEIEQVAKSSHTDAPPESKPVVRSNSPTLSEYLKAKAHNTLNDKGLDIATQQNSQAQERARWYNEVLKRISEQVNYVWVKPVQSSTQQWGVIQLTLNSNGYLQDAWIDIPSGNPKLDQSAMRALKQVYRFDIPYSKEMARYYARLEFKYQGGILD